MNTKQLSIGLAIALSVVACKKKETENAKPAEPATAPKPTEPAKPEPAKVEPPKPMTGPELADMYKKCSSLLSDHKFDDFGKTCVADDFVGHEGMGMDVNGAAKLTEMFSQMITAFPDFKADPQLVLVNGRNIFAVSLMTGTNEGTMKMPGMADVPATHKKFATLFFHRLSMNDANKAKEEWAFEDHGTFMAQLGMMPKEAPPHRKAEDAKPLEGAPITVVAADDAKEKANLEATKKGLDAFNGHKAADLLGMMSDDVVESDQAHDKDVKGKKDIEKGLKDFWTAFSDVKATVDPASIWAAGDFTVEIGNIEGTNDHDMGKMKKTGKKVSVPYTEIFQYKDGKVNHIWRFYDSAAFAMQLGLMPMPGPATPPTGEAPKGEAPKGDTKAPDKAPAKK